MHMCARTNKCACPAQVYSLLAVDATQLAPARIVLRISENGQFSVRGTHLKVVSTQEPNFDWVRQIHSTVSEDTAFVSQNPLYNNLCSIDVPCPNRHWSCPYVLSSLFGGSSLTRRTHRHVYLITPGLSVSLVFDSCLQRACVWHMLYTWPFSGRFF